MKVQARLHERFEFEKVQEILGQNYNDALLILEDSSEP